jgi:sugar lactone lactonase YvrE
MIKKGRSMTLTTKPRLSDVVRRAVVVAVGSLVILGYGGVLSASPAAAFVGPSLKTGTTVSVDPAPAPDVYIVDTDHGRVVKVPAAGGPDVTIASNLNQPNGVAVDGAGDVFIADTNNHRVVEVPADGGALTTVGSDVYYPNGVAVDAAGDVFIADTGHDRVVKVPAGGGAQVTVGTGLSVPQGVAVDAAGDVFIADTYDSRVVKVSANGGAQTTVGSGLSYPGGVAVDAVGDVFIADSSNSRVVEVPAGGGAQTTVGSGLSYPQGVAVDAAGDVFISDSSHNRVVEVPAGGGVQTTVGSGFAYPRGVAAGAPTAPSTVGHSVALTATVQTSPAGGAPSGQVSFSADGTHLGDADLTGTGSGPYTATFHTADLPLGANHVRARYLGTTGYNASADSAPITVRVKALTGTTVSVDPAPAPDVYIVDGYLGRVVKVPADGGPQTTIVSGLAYPTGVAVDAAGDVFAADPNHDRVVKVPADGGAQTTVGNGLAFPTGVGVDAEGNVFIADTDHDRVVKVPADGGAQTTIASVSDPEVVAVDAAGDVFIVDRWHGQVVEVPADGGPQAIIGSGPIDARGVAVDAAGDVFIADDNYSRVVEVPADGGPQTDIGSGLAYPEAVAVDAAGDVFIADIDNHQVVEVPASGGPQITVSTAAFYPEGVAVDVPPVTSNAADSVALKATVQAPAAGGAPSGQVSFAADGTHLGDVDLTGTGTGPYTATLHTSDLPTGVNHVSAHYLGDTDNAASADSAPITVKITPPPPPAPTGTTVSVDPPPAPDVFIADGGSSRVVEVPAGGGAQTTVGSDLVYPNAVAVDAAGDVFIVDNGNSQVVKVPAGGGPQTTVGSDLNGPFGVAVDAAGNVFIADAYNSRVVEVPAGGGAQTTVGSDLSGPTGVAVDAAGDVFVADAGNNQVVEVPADGGPQTTLGSDLYGPYGVAVDAAGDVYIADNGNNRVVEVPAGGGPQTTVGSDLNHPFGVAVDAAGDVFIADTFNRRVVEVPAGGGAQTTVGSDLSFPAGVAVAAPPVTTNAGDSVALTATVQTSPAGGSPTGQVSFAAGGTHLGDVDLTGSGSGPYTATLHTSDLPAGVNHVSAHYLGDTDNAASAPSAPITVRIRPVITGISPASGPTAGGTSVTITGVGFTNVSKLHFGAVTVTDFTVDSDTQITAISPATAASTVNVRVAAADVWSTVVTADRFKFVPAPPAVTGVSPGSGPTAGGTTVTITGTGFTGATNVKFGTVAAASFTVDSDTQITAVSPAKDTSTVNIRVLAGGTWSPTGPANKYKFVPPAPAVTVVAPNTGPTGGGTVVTITGTGFTGATKVTFGVNAVTAISVDSDTQITVQSPPATNPGRINVRVRTPGGLSPITAADRYTYT